MNIGEEVLLKLKEEIDNNEYEKYIKKLKYSTKYSTDEIKYFISTNIYIAKWVTTKYQIKMAEIFEIINRVKPKIRIDIEEGLSNTKILINQNNSKRSSSKSTILNPSLTFESFITGQSNQFAFTIAKSVANNPGKQYNPLFLYGGVGLGKTHLLQAIGNHQQNLGKKVIYTTVEQFMNKFRSHIKSKSMDRFRTHFRDCDILLIDDVQFFSQKDQTQEEFFHTFNELHANNKQIIMTSDRPASKIKGLADRLKSRFEWGLMADIQPPGLETKIAIIKKKCELDGIILNNETVNYLAINMGDNIREIEGTIIKVNALASILSQKITLDFTINAIKDQLEEKRKNISIDDIIDVVSTELNVKPSDIKSKKRNKIIVYSRRISIFLARNLTPNSMPQIAKYFGMKDHTTISHSMRKIKEIIDFDEKVKLLIDELSNKIARNTQKNNQIQDK